MKFEAVELNEIDKYCFVIGTKVRPDNSIKEGIRAQIGEAMESLGFSPESYSVTVIKEDNPTDKPEESGYPTLGFGKKYILFAILGDSAASLSNQELEEQRAELARGIFPPEDSQIALVLLEDWQISIVVSKGVPRAFISGVSYDRFTPSQREGYRRR